jgi:nitrite reductase (NO-forming)
MWSIDNVKHSVSGFAFILVLFLFSPTISAGQNTANIIRDPTDVPLSAGNRPSQVVSVPLVAEEVVATLDSSSGASYRYWTFNGKVPGPMIRVRQGDTVQVTLRNESTSHMVHSVDFHAAIGPGGGAELSQVLPGQSKTFTFVATTPGLYVYHCGTPMIADHIANGMYGLILVEPAGGLPHVDHEYYVMQGEIYTSSPKGKPGLQAFSEAKLMAESPEYFVFNGAVEALSKQYPLHSSAGETVRMFFGNAGPNETSSLHMVGEIFKRDFELGSLTSPPLQDVQTVGVPPGAAAILELKTDMAGKFMLMDHAMSRMAKGLVGVLDVNGNDVARLMYSGGMPANAAPPALAVTADDARITESLPAANVRSESGSFPNGDVRPTGVTIKQSQHHFPAHTLSSATSTELSGCLTLDGQMPKLTVFHSRRIYRLQGRPMLLSDNPLLFANNVNSLVHVTGRMTSMMDAYDADRSPVFEVGTVDQLASTCNVTESLAQLRRARQKQSQAQQVTSVSAKITNQIHMTDMAFVPPTVEVGVGQQVVWHNTSSAVHNVVDDASKALDKADVALPFSVKPFDSGYLQPGQSFARVFTQPGIYRYVCTLHEGNGMKGVVVVRPRTNIANAGPGSAQPENNNR